MANVPKGATIVKEEVSNEAGKKLREIKKTSSFEDFLETAKRKEQESLKPLSSDLEVIEDVDSKLLQELQKEKRLYGWNEKTKTALVLKIAFAKKKDKLKKGE